MVVLVILVVAIVIMAVLGAVFIVRAEAETACIRNRLQKNLYEVTDLSVRIPGRGFVPADINARYN